MTVSIPTLHEQLADAVRFCRQQRHHPDCRCHSWRDAEGEAFCNPMESSWNRTVSICLDRVRGILV